MRQRLTEGNLPEGVVARVRYTGPEDPNRTTVARLVERDTNRTLAVAEARCSDEDNFSRKIGRSMAIGRAMKIMHAKGWL